MLEWKPLGIAGGIALMLVCSCIPRVAQAGFFEQLFGGAQPGYQAGPSDDEGGFFAPRHGLRRLHRSHRISDEKPMRQATTDIMHDPTLRPGDAYMTASGLKIFIGDISDVHDEADFAPLADVHFLKRSERVQLAELDPSHSAAPAETTRPVARRPAYSVRRAAPAIQQEQAALSGTVRYVGP